MDLGWPRMCMSTTPAPERAITRAISGSPRRAVTSLTIEAPPRERQLGDTALGRVDRDRNVVRTAETLEHRHDPAQLFLEAHGVGPRTR